MVRKETLKKTLIVLDEYIHGDLLLKVKGFLPHIAVVFLLSTFVIYAKLKIDDTMIKLEKSTEELETIRIRHAQKTCEYAGMGKLSSIEGLLERNGINLELPQKPADRIRTK